MIDTQVNKVLRSILIAGDSNLKQLVPMFEYLVRTLCIPGAKVQNDRKEFYSQLMSAMKTENPDQIVLHLVSNDVFGDVESTVSRCSFIDYAQLFIPAVHLGREGLHVNRNGAFILKMTLENYLAERQECVTAMIATSSSSHVQVPDVESLSPKMTYAEVDIEHQNSSRTPSKRKRVSSTWARRSKNKSILVELIDLGLDWDFFNEVNKTDQERIRSKKELKYSILAFAIVGTVTFILQQVAIYYDSRKNYSHLTYSTTMSFISTWVEDIPKLSWPFV
ncbi:unnamed protein product [Mytilus coruscus]|uniref:Uncharacterized protein n=1 Tax=Mytilus coruscus TaxID=42192 RepID=A0A6J8DVE9_MYTCO|nr:unnamed protein product [Mytilus coruscus]